MRAHNESVLRQKLSETIERYNMVSRGGRVLMAVSGGVDSVVLLRILSSMAPDWGLDLAIAHLDHRMRPDSGVDADFVRSLAEELKLPIMLETANVPEMIRKTKRSPEEAARVARYDFLRRAGAKFEAKRIALGHNLNDRVETFFINLLRGSGLPGLAGMPPIRRECNVEYIRPLIECSRAEIEAAARANGWEFCQDPTNLDLAYTRNRVRLELIPVLERCNPGALEAVARAAETLGKANRFVGALAREALEQVLLSESAEEVVLERSALVQFDEFLLESVIREAVRKVKHNLAGVEAVHIKRAVSEITKQSSGAWVPLADQLRLITEAERIIITRREAPVREALSIEVPVQAERVRHLDAMGWRFEVEVLPGGRPAAAEGHLEAVFDFDKISLPLVMRNWQPGDRLRPMGLSGEKKLQDLFVDAKVPKERRHRIPILCDSQGILWVVGLRVSERGRLTSATKRTLRIRASLNEQE